MSVNRIESQPSSGLRPFEAVKVFSATTSSDRNALGERVTDWMRRNPGLEPVETIVTQSSDDEFHCVTITLFYRLPEGASSVGQ